MKTFVLGFIFSLALVFAFPLIQEKSASDWLNTSFVFKNPFKGEPEKSKKFNDYKIDHDMAINISEDILITANNDLFDALNRMDYLINNNKAIPVEDYQALERMGIRLFEITEYCDDIREELIQMVAANIMYCTLSVELYASKVK